MKDIIFLRWLLSLLPTNIATRLSAIYGRLGGLQLSPLTPEEARNFGTFLPARSLSLIMPNSNDPRTVETGVIATALAMAVGLSNLASPYKLISAVGSLSRNFNNHSFVSRIVEICINHMHPNVKGMLNAINANDLTTALNLYLTLDIYLTENVTRMVGEPNLKMAATKTDWVGEQSVPSRMIDPNTGLINGQTLEAFRIEQLTAYSKNQKLVPKWMISLDKATINAICKVFSPNAPSVAPITSFVMAPFTIVNPSTSYTLPINTNQGWMAAFGWTPAIITRWAEMAGNNYTAGEKISGASGATTFNVTHFLVQKKDLELTAGTFIPRPAMTAAQLVNCMSARVKAHAIEEARAYLGALMFDGTKTLNSVQQNRSCLWEVATMIRDMMTANVHVDQSYEWWINNTIDPMFDKLSEIGDTTSLDSADEYFPTTLDVLGSQMNEKGGMGDFFKKAMKNLFSKEAKGVVNLIGAIPGYGGLIKSAYNVVADVAKPMLDQPNDKAARVRGAVENSEAIPADSGVVNVIKDIISNPQNVERVMSLFTPEKGDIEDDDEEGDFDDIDED